jgi:DNA-binding HxlR family transcriptional regulator
MRFGALSACGCLSRGCLCPANRFARLFGRRHALSVMSLLANRGTSRFGELRAHLRRASTSTLSAILRDLSREGFVVRLVYAEKPPRVEYKLSGAGGEVARTLLRLRRLYSS